jgi:acylphosphatase
MSAAFHAIVHGRVQGVSFRYHTMRTATPLGLQGWVRNLPDGTVEVQAEGERAALEELAKWLEHGPDYARVTDLKLEWVEPEGGHDGFDIRF